MENHVQVVEAPSFRGAGFRIRALARIIDYTFGLFIGIFAGIIAAIVLAVLEADGSVAPGWDQRMQGLSLATFVLSLIGNVFYHAVCEGFHGASLGKLICRLRVITEDGTNSTLKGAFLRSGAYLIDGLFWGLVGYASMKKSELQQRLGDKWGRTIVLPSADAPSDSKRSGARFMVAIFLGSSIWGLLLVLGVILHVN